MTNDEKLDMIIELLEILLKRTPSRNEQWLRDGCWGQVQGGEDVD